MLLDTPLCDFGKTAPDFNLPDPTGKIYSLTDCMGTNGILIAFICNHCPYVKAIIGRLVADVNQLKNDGINTVAIMSNDYNYVPEDNPENMLKFAKAHNMDFPYLIDETQEIGKAYEAVCTPDFFGYNKNKELQYRGRLDDSKMDDDKNRTPELLNAMRQIAKTGKTTNQQFASMGCSIKWR